MEIPELKRQYVWAIVLLVFISAVLFPINAPFPMSDITVQIYNEINSLKPGQIVVVGGAWDFAFDLESSAAMIPALRQLATRHVKIVFAPFAVESVQFEKYCMVASGIDSAQGGPYKYGVDWVQFGYIPGLPAAMVGFLNDVHSAVPTDVYGTPDAKIPLLQNFTSWKDITLWICPHWSFDVVVRYCTADHGIPAIYFAQSAAYAAYSPYMQAYPGKVWMTNGYLGGAQYENLMHTTGVGHAAINAYYLLSAVFVVIIILGNVTMLTKMRKKEEKK